MYCTVLLCPEPRVYPHRPAAADAELPRPQACSLQTAQFSPDRSFLGLGVFVENHATSPYTIHQQQSKCRAVSVIRQRQHVILVQHSWTNIVFEIIHRQDSRCWIYRYRVSAFLKIYIQIVGNVCTVDFNKNLQYQIQCSQGRLINGKVDVDLDIFSPANVLPQAAPDV